MSAHESGAVLVTLCVLALVYAFFRFTPLGLAMRAAAQNPVSSRLVGIRVGWMLAIGWGLAAAIGSVAGMMAAPIVYLDPNMMGGILLYAFAGALLGGIDNPFGAVFGGFAVGVLGNLVGAYRRRRRGQALGRACDHHRRPGLAAVRPVRAAARGEGLTMADADGALRALAALALGVFALAFPFFASGYHIYQGAQVLIFAVALLGLNLLDRVQRPDIARPRRFFRHRRLWAAILMAKLGVPYWAAIPVASVVCFVAGFLFGFPALRFGGLYLALATFALAVATPQILSYKGFDAFTGGSQGLSLAKPHAPLDLPLSVDQWLYLCCLLSAAALYWAARNLVRGRIGRALIAIRDQPIAAEAMGVNAALYKTTCFGVSALYAGVAGGLSAVAVGFVSPESFELPVSFAFLVGIVVGGLASLGGVVFGALFIEFVPNLADQLTVSFGESAKALPGAVYGVLLILVMVLMPTARRARRGRRRELWRAGSARAEGPKFKTAAQPQARPPNTEEREKPHDHSTFIPAIERRRRGIRRNRRFGPR